MKQLFEEFIHSKLLNALEYFHNICTKEGIKYSLYGGTLIGAVRHKGFIPWDDDIDVAMTRAEYEKLKNVIDKYQSDEFLFNYKGDRVPELNYRNAVEYGTMTYNGLGVDIYIIDNLPDNNFLRKCLILRMKILQGMMKKGKLNYWKTYSFKGKILVIATKILGAGISLNRLCEIYEKLSQKYNKKETKNKFVSNDLYAVFAKPFDKNDFDEYIAVPFEDKKFFIFKKFDPILRTQYGDYMQLPPEKDRHFYHVSEENK